MNLRFLAVAFAFAVSYGLPAKAQLTVGQFILEPQAPKFNDTIRVTALPAAGCDTPRTRDVTTVMSANRITVTLPIAAGDTCFPVPPPIANQVDVSIGQLPAGNYELEVLSVRNGVTTSLGTRSFTVQARAASDPLVNYTDLWWNPQESGWGLNIVQHPSNMIFATWFTYDDDGRPGWYVVPMGEWSAADQGRNFANHFFTGPIYRTSGPTGGVIDPSRVTRTQVGTARFEFIGWNSLRAILTIEGRTSEKNLQRQSF